MGVEEEDRHNVGETDRLGVEVPVRDTVGLTDEHPDTLAGMLGESDRAGETLALEH